MHGRTIRNVAATLALAGATAWAAVDVEIRNGDRVSGTLSPATEVEIIRFRAPKDAVLTVKGAAAKKGPQIHVDLKSPGGGAPVASAEGKTATISKVKATESGLWSVEVSSKDHATAGDYSLSVAWKSATSYGGKRAVAAGVLDVPFSADADATATFAVKKAKKSPAVPTLATFTSLVDSSVDPLADTSAKRVVARTGDCVLRVTSPADGDVTATVKVKPPKPSKRKYALTSGAIGGGDPAGDTAFSGLVGADGGLVAFPALAPGEAGAQLDGASVLVPPGSLPAGTSIVIATAPDIAATGTDVGAGATVAFGPDGLRFDTVDKTKTATITIPFDVAFLSMKDQLTIYTRDAKGAVTPVAKPYAFDAASGTVSFASSHFSSYRAVAPGKPGGTTQNDFQTLTTETDPLDVCDAFDPNTTTPTPIRFYVAEGAGRTVGALRMTTAGTSFMREVWVGGGTSNATPIDRTQFLFKDDVTSVFAVPGGTLYVATKTQVFVVGGATGAVSLVAGTGAQGDTGDNASPQQATFTSIRNVIADLNGGVFIADVGAHRIRFIPPGGNIVAWAGNGTSGVSADGGPVAVTSFVGPTDVQFAPTGGLYVADGGRVRLINPFSPSGAVNVTVAGDASGGTGFAGDGGAPLSATFRSLVGISKYIDPQNPTDDQFVVTDALDQTVRLVNRTAGVVTLLAGAHGTAGFNGDAGNAPGLLSSPNAVLSTGGGTTLVISDPGNQRIRAIVHP